MAANKKPSYEAPLAVVTLLLLIYWFYRIDWLIPTALILALAVLLFKPVARALNFAWERLIAAIGWINSRVLLGTIFFILLTPMAWLARLFRGDQLGLKNKSDSFFEVREHSFEPKDLENPW